MPPGKLNSRDFASAAKVALRTGAGKSTDNAAGEVEMADDAIACIRDKKVDPIRRDTRGEAELRTAADGIVHVTFDARPGDAGNRVGSEFKLADHMVVGIGNKEIGAIGRDPRRVTKFRGGTGTVNVVRSAAASDGWNRGIEGLSRHGDAVGPGREAILSRYRDADVIAAFNQIDVIRYNPRRDRNAIDLESGIGIRGRCRHSGGWLEKWRRGCIAELRTLEDLVQCASAYG